jgi:hypothetical protein
MIEKVTSYKTEDGKIFSEKENAENHAVYLINERKFVEATKKVKQIFQQELIMYANSTKEYSGISLNYVDLEGDFWDDVSGALANDSNIDITIEDFGEYVSLIKALLKDFHLEKTIKVIKKIMCDDIKETV